VKGITTGSRSPSTRGQSTPPELIRIALEIPLEQIAVPRKRMRALRPKFVIELAASMRKLGLIIPVVVRPRKAGGYWLVAGWHRLEAAKRLGWETIEADVWRMNRLTDMKR
jgi:sulfiredoxin